MRYRNRGLAIIGPKGAGKTTLAMHLLARGGMLLGSDMGSLRAGRGRLQAFAVPHMCRITPATARDNLQLNRLLHERLATDHLDGPVFFGGKIELYAPGVNAVFERPLHVTALAVDALLFPNFSAGCDRLDLKQIPWNAAWPLLLDRLTNDPPLAEWLPFEEVRNRDALWRGALLDWNSLNLSAVEIEFGDRDTLDWQAIDRLVDEL